MLAGAVLSLLAGCLGALAGVFGKFAMQHDTLAFKLLSVYAGDELVRPLARACMRR
jgi:hypothetical protein